MSEKRTLSSLPADEVDLIEWLGLFWRHRRTVLVVVICCVMIAGAIGVLRAPEYTARAQVLVASAGGASGGSAADPTSAVSIIGDLIGGARPRSNITHASAMEDPALLRRALARLSPQDRSWFREQEVVIPGKVVEIRPELNSELVGLSVTSHSAQASAAYADAIVATYAEFTRDAAAKMASEAAVKLLPEAERARRESVQADRALNARRRTSGVYNPNVALKSAADLEAVLREQASQARVDLASTRRQLAATEQLRKTLPAEVPSSATIKPSAGRKRLERNLADLRIEAVRARARSGADSPEARTLDAQLAAAEKSAAAAGEQTFTERQREANPTRLAVEEEEAELRGEEAALQEELDATNRELRSQQAWQDKLAREESEQNRLSVAAAAARASYTAIMNQLSALSTASLGRLPSAVAVGRATVQRNPRGLGLLLVTGFLLGILIAVVWLSLREAAARRILRATSLG